ncbi:MAG TPA: (E)-4-hydroxy-3-methylbut-2-enyl-diphosphate synthase, partial [Ilumatobacteraceae bacterium]|nr:(E)-4-hydroxy-3-methylbut-2-enyl-diphosphate synthase [Ilumatobacteraceae bacterium]
RQIHVGGVAVGGGAPVSIQSMTITKTADVEGTLQQIYALAAAGCDIVRCTCNEAEAAEGLAQIVPRSPIPVIADIHHQYRMALAALEAGVQGLRLNPGNIRRPEHIKAVAEECRDRGVPIRIGVNGGSLDPKLYEKYGGKVTPEAMVESAQQELAYFAEVGFDDVKISVKASNVMLMIEAYRQLSEVTDHPLHLGVTEAGPLPGGLVKATAGIATLLAEGIGDTIRYSLTADPIEEARAGRQLLEAMVESAMREIAYFEEVDFDLVKISVKASSVPLMVEAYRQLSAVTDFPLHLGVTEAGPPPAGLVKGTAGIATLLMEGIGDTIRYSLTADPVEEAKAGRQLLEALGLRERKNVDLIACPSCGRAEVDVIDIAQRAMEAFGERQLPLQVAVMGCVVNGPGEAREADLGIAAGNKRGHLFVKGRNIAVVPESEMVEALVEWAEFINEHGTEAAIARADTALAEREAAKDRSMLLDAQGSDANHADEKIVEIRKTVSG